MKKRNMRVASAVIAAMVTVQTLGAAPLVSAADKITKVVSESQAQMSSEKEVVYNW